MPADYPTAAHQQAAEAIVAFFQIRPETEAVLLVNSCARGKATQDSCLDIAVLIAPAIFAESQEALETPWREFSAAHPAIVRLRQAGRFSVVHFDYFDGNFDPAIWDDGGGPDGFELEIGNRLAYSVPLWEGSARLEQLKAQWLPFYDEALRRQRLAMVRAACQYDLDHVEWCLSRELYFQAFDRLYRAFQEFLQALFIAHRTYPIAYNKWIREQVEEILGLPELYCQFPSLLQVSQLESTEMAEKAHILQTLVTTWCPE